MNLKKLQKAVEDSGGTWERARRGGHVIVRDSKGRQIAVGSGSPSDFRSMPNFVSQLRRAGVKIPRKGERT